MVGDLFQRRYWVIIVIIFTGSSIPLPSYPYTVYATREGLVGYTTANGHVIVLEDWFVALPHRNPLSPNDSTNGWDSKVRVTYGDRSVIAPVWDVGPWNTRDNYWDIESARDIYDRLLEYWQTYDSPRNPLPPLWDPDSFPVPPQSPPLGQGNPEAWEAFHTSEMYSPLSYNYGCDQFGRHRWYTPAPLNGAAMDLADGVFWNGLQLPDNDTVDWDFTGELPMVERVILTQIRGVDTVYIYDSQTGTSEPAEEGVLTFEIHFDETMNTQNLPEVTFGLNSPYTDFGVTASSGWNKTIYEDDAWIGTITITGQMQICCGGTHHIRIVARDLGNNQIDGDEDTILYNPGPDTIHQFMISFLDIGVTALPAPLDTVFADSTYTPQAWIQNFGNLTLDSINMVATIDGYADTQMVVSLSPGDSALVSFQGWIVPPIDSTNYLFTVCANVLDDADTINDCTSKPIFAYFPFHDIGVTVLPSPRDTVFTDFTYTPQARIQNIGSYIESAISLIATIGDYADTQVVSSLSPGDSTLVTFQDWTVPSAASVTYLFTACTEVVGDADTTNNCGKKTIFALDPDPFRIEPNPFSSEAVIHYQLPRPAHVILKIYDISGRFVRILVNEEKGVGDFTVPWKGRDEEGRRVRSGVYFYRMETKDFVRTRKLVFLR